MAGAGKAQFDLWTRGPLPVKTVTIDCVLQSLARARAADANRAAAQTRRRNEERPRASGLGGQMMKCSFRDVLLGGVSSALLAAAPAWAQQSANPASQPSTAAQGAVVQEVVVTARQRAETLQNVPAPVNVLTADQIAAAGVTRAENIVGLTPGVSMVNATAEQGDTQVNIRGINSARDAQNSFAFVLDGIQVANPAPVNRA